MAGLQLSGYLPGQDHNGLGALADQLAAGFDEAYETGELEPRVLVVGLVHPLACKHKRDDEGNATHAVELRFLEIEPVEGEHAAQVHALLSRLRHERTGKAELPFDEDTVVNDRAGADAGHDVPETPLRPLAAVPSPFTSEDA